MRFTLNTVVFAIASASLLAPSVWAIPVETKETSRIHNVEPDQNNKRFNPSDIDTAVGNKVSFRRSAPIVVRVAGSDLVDDLNGIADSMGGAGNTSSSMRAFISEVVGVMKDIQGNSNSADGSLDITQSDNNIIGDLINKINGALADLQSNSSQLQTQMSKFQVALAQDGVLAPGSDDDN